MDPSSGFQLGVTGKLGVERSELAKHETIVMSQHILSQKREGWKLT